jgi:hypothetical protein
MALRRPPTRIELKSDDIEEYDEVSYSVKGVLDSDATMQSSNDLDLTMVYTSLASV